MQVSLQERGGVLYIFLDGELDEHTAADARRYIDSAVLKYTRINKAVIDLSKVAFMDSTGIGFLIGRYKAFRRFGLPVYIANPNRATDKILLIGGIYAIIPKV
ncbi:MAG: STAS domain-containing protein [Clostridia bacterium]|nr:STAS domain-containing protein [Clostridia bacterium]